MLTQISPLIVNYFRSIVRDRVLYAVLAVAAVMILAVPALSSFSMRQVQELAITLSLSSVSVVLLVVTLLLGSASVWRDVERRYTASVLSLPISRGAYLLSKFVSIALFQFLCLCLLGVGAAVVILLAAHSYPSDLPIHWGNILLTLLGDWFKYMLLAGVALLLSSVSTSFYLPFFGTLTVFFCGSASQEVFEYVSSQFGQGIHPLSNKAITFVYYLLPNFSGFNFQVEAVYGLAVPLDGVFFSLCYAVVYIAILLGLAVYAFGRRELP